MSAYNPRPNNTSNDPALVDAAMTGTVFTNTTQSPTKGNVGNSATAFPTIQILAKSSGFTTNTSTPTIVPSSTPLIISPTSSTLRDHLIEYIFQILGITAAIVFGVWSIKSYSISIAANSLSSQSLSLARKANDIAQMSFQQTIYQNRLALLSFCMGNTDVRFNETCVEVLEFMAPTSVTTSGPGGLAGIASAVGITSASPTSTPTGSASLTRTSTGGASPTVTPTVGANPGHLGSDSELPFGGIVGIITAFVVIAGIISVILLKRTPSPRSLQRHWVYEDEERIRSKA
ncbi:hypothetical protein B0H13DRAFT_1902326 [Mycena leptocephala]|nr:hypothetical protein B0H13DRAFT_1902326 [Mycena leptocephala]